MLVQVRVRARRASMSLVVLRTFLTLITDESPDPSYTRASSAPPALHYAETCPPSPGGDDAPGPASASSEPCTKKPTKKGSTTVAADPDDLVFAEYEGIVAQETAQLQAEPVEPITKTRVRRHSRGGVNREAADAQRDAGHRVSSGANDEAMAKVRAFFENVRICLRPHVHEPNDTRPADAIFLFREGLGDIGIEWSPRFSTTTLRAWLLGINGYGWDDGYVVACGDKYVPTGSTVGEQGIAPGARLRLVQLADVASRVS